MWIIVTGFPRNSVQVLLLSMAHFVLPVIYQVRVRKCQTSQVTASTKTRHIRCLWLSGVLTIFMGKEQTWYWIYIHLPIPKHQIHLPLYSAMLLFHYSHFLQKLCSMFNWSIRYNPFVLLVLCVKERYDFCSHSYGNGN